jgi:hypothetical protein
MSSSSSSTELEPHARAAAERMLATVNSDQYVEALSDDRVKGAVGSLVLRSAQAGQELSPIAVDYAIEAFSRHGLSEEEVVALSPNTSTQTPEEVEEHLRVQHVALELVRDHTDLRAQAQGDARELARLRIESTQAFMGLVNRIEALADERVDEESLTQLADEYRQYLISIEGAAIETQSALEDLEQASPESLLGFLANRYFKSEPPVR